MLTPAGTVMVVAAKQDLRRTEVGDVNLLQAGWLWAGKLVRAHCGGERQ